ncbi:MAG: Ig-like domain-containing protein [Myxococcaceae bacterium]|nr:Ig-like domain-containing protein [Myxococcaceae bacterium]
MSPDGGAGGGAIGGGTAGGSGGGLVDVVPPTLTATTPSTGATAVAVDSSVLLTFSEAMAPASVMLSATPTVAFSAPVMDGEGTRFSFTSSAPFAVSTTYTLTVTGTDLAGNALAGLATFSFTTRGPPDVTAPIVNAFLPMGVGVALDAGLVITFSERMDPGSVSVQLVPVHALDAPTFDASEKVATFAPSTPLEPSTSYTATIAGNDASGNALTGTTTFGFTTRALPDSTRPLIRSVSPADQSTGVAPSARTSVTFSERMSVSATEFAFALRKQGGAPVVGTFKWDLAGSVMTFDPTADLDPTSVYLVSVGTGARDSAGNTLLSAFSSQFTTAAVPDTTLPQVTRVTPLSGSAGLPRCDWTFVITFSETMDVASTQAAVSVQQTAPSTKPIAFTPEWSRDATRLTILRAAGADCFDYGATARLEISTSADDLAGNRLASAFSSTASVIRQGTAEVRGSPGLSRSVFETGSFNSAALWAGEADEDGNGVRTLLHFPLTMVPASSVITQATLKLRIAEGGGQPFTSLGPLFADSVDVGGTHEPADYDAPVLPSCLVVPPPPGCAAVGFHKQFATEAWYGDRTLDVTRAVFADFARGSRSQFRLEFLTERSNNGMLDYVRFAGGPISEQTGAPRLRITWEYP